MAAIGSVWAPNTWADDTWAEFTWGDASPPVTIVDPPSPHRLSAVDYVTNELDVVGDNRGLLFWDPIDTSLTWFNSEGVEMAVPLIFSRTETGPITLRCVGADGTPEDLAAANAVTLTVAPVAGGTAIVNGVALTSPTADGTAVWTRLTAQVATSGDYKGQVKVTRSDGSIGLYPNAVALPGMAMTILPIVGD